MRDGGTGRHFSIRNLCAVGAAGVKGRIFFSEEKKLKTFVRLVLSSVQPSATGPTNKSLFASFSEVK